MAQLSDLTKEGILVSELKNLIEVLEESAAEKCRAQRDKILSTRDFLKQLAQLSTAVGADLANASAIKTKKALVFLSASGGMYGNLIQLVLQEFLRAVKADKDQKTEAVVVGELGRQLMREFAPGIKFRYADMNEDLELLKQYSYLKVFYAKFKNVAVQLASGDELSGRIVAEYIRNSGGKRAATQFIYEPSQDMVTAKFNREIFHDLLAGMMEEHRLAKQAARLMQLDEAIDNINERLSDLQNQTRQSRKKQEDKKQQNRMVRFIRC